MRQCCRGSKETKVVGLLRAPKSLRLRPLWKKQHDFGIRMDMRKPENVSFLAGKLQATLEYAVGFETRAPAGWSDATYAVTAVSPSAVPSNARRGDDPSVGSAPAPAIK